MQTFLGVVSASACLPMMSCAGNGAMHDGGVAGSAEAPKHADKLSSHVEGKAQDIADNAKPMAEDVSKQAEGKAQDLGDQAHSTAEDASQNLQGKAKWV